MRALVLLVCMLLCLPSLAEARKPAKSKFKKGMTVVVKSKNVPVLDRPAGGAEELFQAQKGEKMTVLKVSKNRQWVRVEDETGSSGWIKAKALRLASEADREEEEAEAEPEPEPEPEPEAEAEDEDDREPEPDPDRVRGGRGKPSNLAVRATASLTYVARSQGFESNGTGTFAQYDLSSAAPAVMVRAEAQKQYPKYVLGVDAQAIMTVGGNGIEYDAMEDPLAWSSLIVDVRAAFGYRVSPKVIVAGRAGYHTEATNIDESPVVRLPSESVRGIAAGAGVSAWATPKLELAFAFDALFSAKLLQTDGAMDGDESSASVYMACAHASYRLGPKLSALVSYSLTMASFEFSGASQRDATSTEASRSDTQHVVGAGLGYAF